jgi:type II secretory pathway component PulK
LDTTIKSVKIGCRYAKSGGGGITPRLEVLYTTDGVFPQAGNSSFDTAVSSASYNAAPFVVLDITHDRAWTWSLLNNPNFQIRARAYNSSNRRVYLDYLFLQVTYGIDTLAEPWATGSFASFPIALGSGNITSVSLEDEQGKVNLNAASLSLLRYLLEECGVASGTALTLASSVVAYRATKPFDSVEELQQVSGMTAAVYNQIKDFVTVCSFVNASAARPSGSRSPVNVNTAPREVLEAVFDPLGLGATDPARLAADILSARAAAPFDCFYASVSAADFYDFVNSRSYLTATERNIVLDNADASALVPVYGYAGSNAVTTEFCYASGALAVDSLAGVGGRNFRVKTVLGQDGNATGYRKESFE